MNPVDIGVIGVIGLSAVFALARGFVREVLSIVAWAGAAFFTFYAHDYVYALVDPMVHNPLLSQIAAWAGLFVLGLIMLTILTGIVARTIRSSDLSLIDRTLGFVFGLVRGAFVLSLVYLVLDMVQPADRPEWLRDAKSAPYLQQGADFLRKYLPEQWRSKSAAAADDLVRTGTAAIDAERAIRAYSSPTAPPQSPEPGGAPVYKPNEQHQMDRIFSNQH